MALRQKTHYFTQRTNLRLADSSDEPVDVIDLKQHLKIWEDDQDRYLSDLILEARTEFEDLTNIALISQTRKLLMDAWDKRPEPWWDGVREYPITELYAGSSRHIDLPIFPVISVDSVTVYDRDSASTSVTIADTFDVDLVSKPARLSLQSGATWPSATRANNAIEIQYTAGYGTKPSDVPPPLRRAVRQMAGYLYTNRGSGCSAAEAFSKSGAEGIARIYGLTRI